MDGAVDTDTILMNISLHFTLREYTRSATAAKLGIVNEPPAATLVGNGTVRMLFLKVMEPIRVQFGPLNLTSGYRCPELNTAINGSATSDHIADEFGAACDFVPADREIAMEDVFQWIRASELPFDQCILEYADAEERPACIHISWRPDARRMAGIASTHSRGKVKEWLSVGAESA